MTVTAVEKVDPSEVRIGDVMSFTYWGVVDKVESSLLGKRIELTDLDSGNEFAVEGDMLIKNSSSSDQYNSQQKVSKSQAVEILSRSYNSPFTVVFTKKDGSTRRLRGRLIGIDQKNLGYVDVEDLDKPIGSRFRLVDCRTIKSIIVDNVKYIV
jgi:hypothetical protein